MDISVIQVVLVFLVTFVVAIDQFDFLESLYQPIVVGPAIGLILGDLQTGLIVGGTYQLMTIGNMPVGGAQPPNAVMGGIMSTIMAITLGLEPTAAAATAIPFALLGQYGVTIIFTLRAPMMTLADKYAQKGDSKGIVRMTYLSMLLMGSIFGVIVVLFFIGGATFGRQLVSAIPQWLMDGLSAAGGMMRYVGFAILMKVMISKEMWGFYFCGFAIACLMGAIGSLSGSALLLIALIGFAIAFWDYQIQTKLKESGGSPVVAGGEEDGI